jgi:hypothetical protein
MGTDHVLKMIRKTWSVPIFTMNLLYENADAGEELLPMPSFVKRQKK